MLIFYDTASLAVRHIVTSHSDDYRTWAMGGNGEPCVETAEAIPPEMLLLTRDAAGAVAVGRKGTMSVAGPTSGPMGVEVSFSGIPEGATVRCNGRILGVMDASGTLEFTPGSDGTFTLLFLHPAYVTTRFDYESHRQL